LVGGVVELLDFGSARLLLIQQLVVMGLALIVGRLAHRLDRLAQLPGLGKPRRYGALDVFSRLLSKCFKRRAARRDRLL